MTAQAKACGYPADLQGGAAHVNACRTLMGQGGLNKLWIIPLNPPLGKGDLKPPFPTFHSLRTYLQSKTGFEIGSRFRATPGSTPTRDLLYLWGLLGIRAPALPPPP